jgi:CRP/FNR family transcriptional regulator, cyclic AMP receptor protein
MSKATEEIVRRYFSQFPSRTFLKNEVISRPQESLPGILYLTSGTVNQYDIANDGRRIFVNTFLPPAFFPMSWALNHIPQRYFFEAATITTAHCAPPAKVISLLEEYPDVTLDLLCRVYRGTEGLQRRMAHALGGNAHTRILFELTVHARRMGRDCPNGRRCAISHQELAERTGLSRETVTRTLRSLQEEGLISLAYGAITIHQMEVLSDSLGSQL